MARALPKRGACWSWPAWRTYRHATGQMEEHQLLAGAGRRGSRVWIPTASSSLKIAYALARGHRRGTEPPLINRYNCP